MRHQPAASQPRPFPYTPLFTPLYVLANTAGDAVGAPAGKEDAAAGFVPRVTFDAARRAIADTHFSLVSRFFSPPSPDRTLTSAVYANARAREAAACSIA